MKFFMCPESLFTDDRYRLLSNEAKILLVLMIDVASLSQKNSARWTDNNGRIYIYFSQEKICERLNCGGDKARKTVRELENAGLIMQCRQGQGKPNKIYVNDVFQTAKNKCSGQRKSKDLECAESVTNNIEENNTKCNHTDSLSFQSRVAVEKRVKDNIAYEILCHELDEMFMDSIIAIMVDAVCTKGKYIKIAGEQHDHSHVCMRLIQLNDIHIRYVYDRFKSETQPIYSPKGYLLKHLFEAEESMHLYYDSKAKRDVDGWGE